MAGRGSGRRKDPGLGSRVAVHSGWHGSSEDQEEFGALTRGLERSCVRVGRPNALSLHMVEPMMGQVVPRGEENDGAGEDGCRIHQRAG
jgi:hypothetical protein